MFKCFVRDGVFKDPRRLAVELTGRDLPSCVSLLEFREEEMRPDPKLRDAAGLGEPPRGFLDIVIHKHIAEIEDYGLDF